MEIHFTDREADVMRVLWERGAATVAEVRDALHDDLAYTTVLTILRTLQDKGYVGHDEEGRTHRYHPLVERQAARKSALRHLADKLFDGSPELLVTQLVSSEKLNREQIGRIRKLLDGKAGKGKS
jgi:BlaI family transcriptional regulator, penicillinase repressor